MSSTPLTLAEPEKTGRRYQARHSPGTIRRLCRNGHELEPRTTWCTLCEKN